MNNQLHEIEETKASLCLEVAELRGELNLLQKNKKEFLQDIHKESLLIVQEVMEKSSRLLSEAKDTTGSIQGFISTLADGSKDLKEAKDEFITWRDIELKSLNSYRDELEKKALDIEQQTKLLTLERLKLNGAIKEVELLTEQSRKDFEKARKERKKLMFNLDHKHIYGKRT